MISETNVLIFSLLGGIVPALFWLWFWIREDRLRPEPKSALLSSFLGGIVAVLFALFLELVIYYLLADAHVSAEARTPAIFWRPLENWASTHNLLDWQAHFWAPIQDFFRNWGTIVTYNVNVKKIFLVVLMAPFIEELLKLIVAYSTCLRRKVNDEPIDASIYMLTTALGFAAVETTLFLTGPLAKGHILDTIIAGNFRSIGPMLIHLVCSAILGIFMGLAFYKNRFQKFLYAVFGFIVAFVLHAIFNFFIVLNETTHNLTFFWIACAETWILVVVLLAFFGQVKKVARKK
jgi:RsiW-degrading membrane proteinase PrsW (M82 family)